jgi:hypothetical protein
MHNFTSQDFTQANNLAKMLSKAKMELEGTEVLAAAEVMRWVGKLLKDIEQNLNAQKTLQAVSKANADTAVSSPVKETPKKRKSKE